MGKEDEEEEEKKDGSDQDELEKDADDVAGEVVDQYLVFCSPIVFFLLFVYIAISWLVIWMCGNSEKLKNCGKYKEWKNECGK